MLGAKGLSAWTSQGEQCHVDCHMDRDSEGVWLLAHTVVKTRE